MFTDTLTKCAANAERIVRLDRDNPFGFWVAAAMAGAYVGLGIILIFTLGNLLDPALRPLVMGATFGIALTLVIIAGAELFTGHTMFLTLGVKTGRISLPAALRAGAQSWGGNLLAPFLSPGCSGKPVVASCCRMAPACCIARPWPRPSCRSVC